MYTDDPILKREGLPPAYILILSHLLFIPLFVLSYIYCRERLFGDSAWYLFRVINTEGFVIEHMRPPLYLWQWFIILLTKAGVGMEILLKGYSVFHVAFFYLAFVIVVHVLKDFRSGLFILLFQVFGISDTFFCWPMWEMWYGLIALAVQLALCRSGRDSFILHFILALFIFMSYPYDIVIWAASIVLVFPGTFIRRYKWRLVLLFVLCIALKSLGGNPYESKRIASIFAGGLGSQVRDILHVDYITALIHFYFFRYTLVSVCILLSIWILRKQKLKLIPYVLLVSGAAFVVNVAFGTIVFGSDAGAIEAYYFIIPAFTLLVLVYNYPGWSSLPERVVMIIFMLLTVAIGAFDIVRVSDVYHERVLMIEHGISYARQTGQHKLVYYDENIRRFNYVYCMFSIPMESMLLSSCGSEHQSVTIAEEHMLDSTRGWGSLRPDQYMMMNDQIFSISSLNKKYFSLNAQPYAILNKKDCKNNIDSAGIIIGTAMFDHYFNTDHLRHHVYHVNATLPQGIYLCSRDTTVHWQVRTDNGRGGLTIYDKQPLGRDAGPTLDDYLVIASDSLSQQRKSYIYLMNNTKVIAKISIP